MLQIKCPWCGVRDEAEFNYAGDASVRRPSAEAGHTAFADFVYTRPNPKGWHIEWWHHAGGCRRYLKALRHTVTHDIAGTGGPADPLENPAP